MDLKKQIAEIDEHSRVVDIALIGQLHNTIFIFNFFSESKKSGICSSLEKMVAVLIASGASAGAVTDPNSQDPTVTCHPSHWRKVNYLKDLLPQKQKEQWILSKQNSSSNEDHIFLKHTLAAVRSSAQAAARIQSAFRAHSFQKRQQREAAVAIGDASRDEYCILAHNIRGISEASKLAFRNGRDHNSAALSIQKKYRGWKGRKDFLAFRQKVVKIQAHVRGYQVRKNCKVCWAVGILDKVILRWRRRGVGLRGFRHDSESIYENEDEDILKVFRKQKVDAAIDEAVSRVLSMVESPDARQQYHRILEKYRQAKAELESGESDIASSSAPTFQHIRAYFPMRKMMRFTS
ncbi:UNVERIFIED_CONTAM: Calmodulin-binding transcription activator 4 [Sesamum calycinum]|uniref:Calmodulin-binding transcription activator 4 n=1 Tax=Sesamum calycinum TaxID=2727403 RepID=A0AAW2QXC4_9LAMI